MKKKQMFYLPSDTKIDEMAIDHTSDGFSAAGRDIPGSLSPKLITLSATIRFLCKAKLIEVVKKKDKS